MKCPECGKKLAGKHWDAEYEWYECPKCEGCFTADEIVRDEVQSHRPTAKGKKRRTAIAEDEELADEMIEAIIKKPRKVADAVHHRDELPTNQIIGIWADEIQDVYHDLGSTIDELNARDKALTIWREIHIHAGVTAREQAVKFALCGEHDA